MDNNFIDITKISIPDGLSKINFNKRAGNYEISCSLFSICNLNCKFCFQNHNDCIVDINKIMEMPNKIVNVIKDDIINYGIDKKIYIRLYGGEPFFDNLSDYVFDVYYKFSNELNNQLKKYFPNLYIEIYWGSNGVFTNHSRVEKLLKETNSLIALSYDPVDRFSNDKQKEIWYNTFKYFYDRKLLSSVSIMLIKPSIEKYMNGDIYFNKIPYNISIDVNQYISNPGYENYQMSDEETFIFYKWAIDNHRFNIDAINNILNNYLTKDGKRHCYCKCSNFFDINGNNTKNCVLKYSKLSPENFYGEFNNDVTEENCTEIKNSLGLQKRGCLYCQYYEFCPTLCWTSIISNNYKTSICPIQKLYEYIDNDPSIMDRFKDWRNKYERDQF